ncbi:hypothetical protein DIPPA_25726 [Diplonema papillatum]|nr:hypothetical protein DIPPA_25726 [Diplonema papillatum]
MAEGAVPNDIIIEALNRAAESHKEGIEHFVPQRPAQDEDADDVDEGLYEEGDEEWEEDEEQEEEEAEAEAPHTTMPCILAVTVVPIILIRKPEVDFFG